MKDRLPVYDISQFIGIGQDNGFYINTVSAHLDKHGFVAKPHKHNHYMVIVCLKGTGMHHIDFDSYEMRPGTLFFVLPGQTHSLTSKGKLEGYVFFHSREFYDMNYVSKRIDDYPFFYCSYNSSVLNLKPAEIPGIVNSFAAMLEEFNNDRFGKLQRICSLLDLLYIDASRLYIPRKKRITHEKPHSTKIRQFEELVNNNFKKIKSPARYAAMLHLTPKQLNRICKEALNKTTSEIIMERAILESKRMLAFGDMNINEVAAETGWLDTAYFTRVFKKQNGETPTRFMKRYREKSMPGY